MVDLEDCTVTAGDLRFDFELDQTKRRMLLDGLDDIALTAPFLGEISAFEATRPGWMPNLSRVDQTT
jgi:3-isopropylmalate/(R)-2-methylmalate dehydratase small subunit